MARICTRQPAAASGSDRRREAERWDPSHPPTPLAETAEAQPRLPTVVTLSEAKGTMLDMAPFTAFRVTSSMNPAYEHRARGSLGGAGGLAGSGS
jgi:hypothetical protein